MGKIRFFGFNQSQSMTTNYFAFSSYVDDSSTKYFFVNSRGETVKMFGTSISVDGAGRITGGVINEIRVAPDGGSPDDIEIHITNINISATNLMGVGGAGVPSTNQIWQRLLEGETDIFGSIDVSNYVFGDLYIASSGTTYGDDDEIQGKFGNSTFLMGDAYQVTGSGVLFGGDDTIDAAARLIRGDAGLVSGSSTLIGGDDEIIMRSANYDSKVATGIVDIIGDAENATSTATLIGGDDFIDASDVEVNTRVNIFGDAESVEGGTTFIGGDDKIIGARNSDNYIYGDVNDFTISGAFAGGRDVITGGKQDDVIYGDVGSSSSGSNGGNDKINGLGGNDTMYGQGGRDIFFALEGSALMYGGNQVDQFRPNKDGEHSFYGGSGDDIINYIKATGGRLTVDLNDSSRNTGWAEDDVISSVAHVVGSATQNNFLYGYSGANILQGGAKSDRIEGRGGGDEISTLGGNDRIEANFGANTYDGGAGFDILSYAASNAGTRVDLFNDTAGGGHAAGDKITGIEHLYGSDFNDKYYGDNARNIFKGYDGNDSLYGRNGDDALYGGANNDRLFGGFGNDIIEGGGGSDKLFGGRGNDFMRGGSGADTFHYDRGDDIDRIRDFQDNVDTIELDGFPANYKPFQNAQQVGNNVVFNFGNGDQLIVENVTAQQLFNDLVIV
ncbi:calcium-binding protein [Yoonia sp. R2331]|uniref:calcium-binding protein n=1 Tax=Yoonia sp. R2331 TaxID=3237238 RepID=UPI0034E59FC5